MRHQATAKQVKLLFGLLSLILVVVGWTAIMSTAAMSLGPSVEQSARDIDRVRAEQDKMEARLSNSIDSMHVDMRERFEILRQDIARTP